jgi:hypothetical protein
MHLTRYLDEVINKDACPESCDLKGRREIEIVRVPPPDEILGIIVSQDPTVDWLYEYLKNESDENIRRKILFASAIPLSLLTKVLIFMKNMNHIGENDKKCLCDVIFQQTYWTHWHKCLTDVTGEVSSKFKPKNGKECANQWLKEELDSAINNKTRFIIALGNHVQSWFRNEWDQAKNRNIKVINLPHPSGQNNPIWYRSEKDEYKNKIINTQQWIRTLVELCKEIKNCRQAKRSPNSG